MQLWVWATCAACACHAGSVSSDTQGLDREVTIVRLTWSRSTARAKAQSPKPVEMAEGLSCYSKKEL